MFWSNNSATTFAIASTDLSVILLLPAINIPKGSAHLVNPFSDNLVLSFADTVCAFLQFITFTFALSVDEAITLPKNYTWSFDNYDSPLFTQEKILVIMKYTYQLWQANTEMARRSVKFMMAIPTKSFKHAKISPKKLFVKKLGCCSIYWIYVNYFLFKRLKICNEYLTFT